MGIKSFNCTETETSEGPYSDISAMSFILRIEETAEIGGGSLLLVVPVASVMV